MIARAPGGSTYIPRESQTRGTVMSHNFTHKNSRHLDNAGLNSRHKAVAAPGEIPLSPGVFPGVFPGISPFAARGRRTRPAVGCGGRGGAAPRPPMLGESAGAGWGIRLARPVQVTRQGPTRVGTPATGRGRVGIRSRLDGRRGVWGGSLPQPWGPGGLPAPPYEAASSRRTPQVTGPSACPARPGWGCSPGCGGGRHQ